GGQYRRRPKRERGRRPHTPCKMTACPIRSMSVSAQPSLPDLCHALAARARAAASDLATATRAPKDRWLLRSADALLRNADAILAANSRDVEAALELSSASKDRLKLTPARLQVAAEGLRQVAALPDPVGQVREGSVRPNG